MSKTLYLLDGMALIYRAHFALIKSPIFTSKGVNTSALYGFTNTILDLLAAQKPDFLAIALDTPEPTWRHETFPAYKAHRDEVPEDILLAIPNIERLATAMNIPVLKYPGHEADDIIGTLASRHGSPDLQVMMVTPDKDFAQLVRPGVSILKPGRMGNPPEILGPVEVKATWGVSDPAHVADVLGLWGDASDNIPGVPGFGEKTAKKLIGQYGSMEGLYAHLAEITGKQKEKLETFRDQAFLCRRLATIHTEVPVKEMPDDLAVRPFNDEALQSLFVEFEFNTIGRRIYGDAFKAGRGHATPSPAATKTKPMSNQGELFNFDEPSEVPAEAMTHPDLKTIADVSHRYELVDDDEAVSRLAEQLISASAFCLDLETDSLDVRSARLAGMAFSWAPHSGVYVNLHRDGVLLGNRLDLLLPALSRPGIEKIGHNLKYDLSVLAWNGIEVAGPFFDTMIAHSLLEPERRHGMDALSEQYLGYTPISIEQVIGDKKSGQRSMLDVDPALVSDYSAEDADVTFQLRQLFKPLLQEQGLDDVFHGIEMPLLPVIIRMERNGIRLDRAALEQASKQLAELIEGLESAIYLKAGCTFNLNSPRQLGEVLFEKMRLIEKPKKTKTGQYSTDESILAELAIEHEIARLVLDYREATKLKSTYVDALPACVFPSTDRIHTSFSQVGAITGRLASSNPNLQNIPIRTSMGQQIRAAFVPSEGRQLFSADYSQIELRVMAELSGDPAMLEAFQSGLDIHAATAARIYQVAVSDVTPEMRRKAKMVNFGIIYGISAFGLAQRLSIARSEAASIIEQYFARYPGVRAYMDRTIAECRAKGFVETLSGRRRWIRDINSANATIRNAAERTAINTPIQGTAADMIKIAMIRVDEQLRRHNVRTRMILQVHDELLFDLVPEEQDQVMALVKVCMQEALSMRVPIAVEAGIGRNWLEAH